MIKYLLLKLGFNPVIKFREFNFFNELVETPINNIFIINGYVVKCIDLHSFSFVFQNATNVKFIILGKLNEKAVKNMSFKEFKEFYKNLNPKSK